MADWLPYVAGLLTLPAIIAFACMAVWIENRIKRYPASDAARLIDARVAAGKNLYARNLFIGKDRVLILLTEDRRLQEEADRG